VSHLIVLPVLLPLFTGALLLLVPPGQAALVRTLGFLSCAALVGFALALFHVAAAGRYVAYPLGNWPAPFGIVLVLDRLAAGMLLLTALVALAAFLYALRGWDERGPHFGALFQFQLMGVNGAFLSGDIFNLFVFFEVLLIASYGLLLHGGGRERLRAGIHYVVINLAGSALFLIALGLLYSVTGSLNFADLQLRYAEAMENDRAFAEAASLLLLIVFCLKAAAFPLSFWLPGAYGAAAAPVAALFAIMTKVGIYAILRVHLATFGSTQPALDGWATLLLPAALFTIALGTFGALAARRLGDLVSYLTIVSVGTLLMTVALATAGSVAAGLYYLVHSTFVTAALFLLVELIGEQRGDHSDALGPGPQVAQPTLLGLMFLVAAIAAAGLPPLSGFFGKVNVLLAAAPAPAAVWIWAVILIGSAIALLAIARAGSLLFWKIELPRVADSAGGATFLRTFAVVILLAPLGGLVVFAEFAWAQATATAAQITHSAGYRDAVLGTGYAGDAVRPHRFDRPRGASE
jgi:multicomponent K+:H+ antiporter subunit D